jgi:cytochrome c oxidase cbb3-type subunit 1
MSDTNLSHHHDPESDGAKAVCIDASVRTPVLLLFGNALHWLVVASFLALLASVKLVAPGFLGGVAFLGYGRLSAMARDLFLYGWASQAAIAAGIWLMARFCNRTLGGVLLRTLINSAVVLWNLAVLLGTLAILAGYSTGVEWLEYPNWASAMLFLSFLMIGIWVVCLFDRRAGIESGSRAEPALWYLVAGFCCFPWVYGTANLLLTWKPLQASAQGAVQGWFCNGFLILWLLPVALGALYGLLTRISGQKVSHSKLVPLGFWLLILFGGWAGLARLIGGPIPAWMASAGVVAGVLFLMPILIVMINLLGLRKVGDNEVNTAWQFLRGGLSFALTAGILAATLAMPSISAFARFTGVTVSLDLLWLFGAISFPLFGVIYASLPGLLGRECWSVSLSGLHYWLTFAGLCLLTTILIFDGFFAGLALLDPVVSFLNITSYSQPFHVLESGARLLLLAASLIVAANFTRALAAERLFPKK